MKCPLFAIATQVIEPQSDVPINDCLREDCAWWLEEEDGSLCAIKAIALELRYTHLRLADIIEKRKGEGGPK